MREVYEVGMSQEDVNAQHAYLEDRDCKDQGVMLDIPLPCEVTDSSSGAIQYD